LRRQPSLRSQLNQIRLWVRQGRTDAWIAHKLDVSIDQLARFKRDHGLAEGATAPARPADPLSVPPPEPESEPEPGADDEDELDALEGDEIELEPAAPSAAERFEADEVSEDGADERAEEERGAGAPAGARRGRRRGRRGGRRRRTRPRSYEATFDHGEEGYGLWLDPAVVDNPVYAEHWAGHRAVKVTLDRDAITIRRADDADDADGHQERQ
jgi:hypothetical protein